MKDERAHDDFGKIEDGVFKPLERMAINEGTIVEVHVPSYADRLRAKSRSVWDFAFYGMWKDRTDIGDSVKCISDIRGRNATSCCMPYLNRSQSQQRR